MVSTGIYLDRYNTHIMTSAPYGFHATFSSFPYSGECRTSNVAVSKLLVLQFTKLEYSFFFPTKGRVFPISVSTHQVNLEPMSINVLPFYFLY